MAIRDLLPDSVATELMFADTFPLVDVALLPDDEMLTHQHLAFYEFVVKCIITHKMKKGIEQGITRGIEQGMTRGIEQGVQQGITQGAQENSRQIALQMLKLNLAMSIITQATGLPESEVLALQAKQA